MEVPLNSDIQAKLTRLAAARGSNAEVLAREAIEHFVHYDEWFISEVDKGLDQIKQGAALSHSEVRNRLEKRIAEKRASA